MFFLYGKDACNSYARDLYFLNVLYGSLNFNQICFRLNNASMINSIYVFLKTKHCFFIVLRVQTF